jgi:type I restriction-modification system DNA methylase subunit
MPIFQKSVANQYIINNVALKDKAIAAFKIYQQLFSAERIAEIKKLKEEEYQDGFLRDLFVTVFGYTLRPDANYTLVRERKNETNGKKADGAIIKDGNIIAVIELKSNKTKDLSAVTNQAFGYKNNNKNCRYVITSNFQYLRLFIDDATEFEEFDLYTINQGRFILLYFLLQQQSFFDDMPAKLKEATAYHEKTITQKLYKDYKAFKDELFLKICAYNRNFDKLTLFKKTQKLLDRLLFVFFAEDAGLIPANANQKMIKDFHDLNDFYDCKTTLYNRYQKLFVALDKGHFYKGWGKVPPYNGGLFRYDEILDAPSFVVDNAVLERHCDTIAKYDFSSEIDVNILGHIFEHSMGEIEEITAELQGEKIEKDKSRRKKDGVFYTPRYITRYIVEATLGKRCEEQRNLLNINNIELDDTKPKKEKNALLEQLQSYKTWLLGLKILDPACGSGAFLNQTLDFLLAEHRRINAIVADINGTEIDFESNDDKLILEQNIFGVDINDESVEIAKLSLWLRTARQGRPLSELSNNIKCGNSLIDSVEIAGEKAFNWQVEFAEIMANGGFDVVLGNPPYRIIFDEIDKTYLSKKYNSFKRNNDLYVAFFCQFINLVKDGGMSGLITPNSYIRGEYFTELRQLLIHYQLNEIVDFGNKIIFVDANVYAAIAIIKKDLAETGWIMKSDLDKIKGYVAPKKEQFIAHNGTFSKLALYPKFNAYFLVKDVGYNYWSVGRGKTRGEGSIGDKVFYSGTQKSPTDTPYLKGTQVNKYAVSQPINFLRHNYSSFLNEGDTFRFSADILATNPKLIYRQTASNLIGAIDYNSYHVDKTLHTIIAKPEFEKAIDLRYVLALFNSKLLHWYYNILTEEAGRAFAQVKIIYVKDLPFMYAPFEEQQPFIQKAEQILALNKTLQSVSGKFMKRFIANFPIKNTTGKLADFYLYDFKIFLAELKKQKIELELRVQDVWQDYFDDCGAEINAVRQQIAQCEGEINRLVYALYQLTAEEIKVVEEQEN